MCGGCQARAAEGSEGTTGSTVPGSWEVASGEERHSGRPLSCPATPRKVSLCESSKKEGRGRGPGTLSNAGAV